MLKMKLRDDIRRFEIKIIFPWPYGAGKYSVAIPKVADRHPSDPL